MDADTNNTPPAGTEILNPDTPRRSRWIRRIKGLFYIGAGLVLLLFALMIVSAASHVDDYYHVPHACESFECAHGMKIYPDGNTYCAKFPPKDIKMAQVSSAYVNLCRFIVAFCGVTALTCAVLTLLLGVQWLLGIRIPQKPARWYVVTARTAPAMAFVLPILAMFFSFPYGIVPM